MPLGMCIEQFIKLAASSEYVTVAGIQLFVLVTLPRAIGCLLSGNVHHLTHVSPYAITRTQWYISSLGQGPDFSLIINSFPNKTH